jgi:hypothetical protein
VKPCEISSSNHDAVVFVEKSLIASFRHPPELGSIGFMNTAGEPMELDTNCQLPIYIVEQKFFA